jgi:hypothetical protein
MSPRSEKQVQHSVDELRKLRDEIRVRLHLAGMEAKSFWEGVEPKLADLEDKLEQGVSATAKYADVVLDELTKAFQHMRDRFGDDTKSH